MMENRLPMFRVRGLAGSPGYWSVGSTHAKLSQFPLIVSF
jgi:hypothetical protein